MPTRFAAARLGPVCAESPFEPPARSPVRQLPAEVRGRRAVARPRVGISRGGSGAAAMSSCTGWAPAAASGGRRLELRRLAAPGGGRDAARPWGCGSRDPPPQDPPTPGVSPPEPELCSGRAEIGAGSPRRCRFVSRDGRGRRADRMNGREQSGAVSPCPRSHPRHPPRSGAGRAAGRSREAPPLLLCHWLRQSRLRAGLPQRWERAAGSPALRAPPAAPSAPPCRAAASSARRRWRLRSEPWATRIARGAPRAPPGRGVGLGSRGQVGAGGGGTRRRLDPWPWGLYGAVAEPGEQTGSEDGD